MTADEWEAKWLNALTLEKCFELQSFPAHKHPMRLKQIEQEKEEEARRIAEATCTCHLGHPPCGFCTSMTEEEVEAYWQGGVAAVHTLRNSK